MRYRKWQFLLKGRVNTEMNASPIRTRIFIKHLQWICFFIVDFLNSKSCDHAPKSLGKARKIQDVIQSHFRSFYVNDNKFRYINSTEKWFLHLFSTNNHWALTISLRKLFLISKNAEICHTFLPRPLDVNMLTSRDDIHGFHAVKFEIFAKCRYRKWNFSDRYRSLVVLAAWVRYFL